MSEDKLAIIAVFGSAVAIVVISLLYSLVKTWIKSRNHSYDDEKFDRLARAFIKYRKDSERRLKNLEALAGKGDKLKSSGNPSEEKSLNVTQSRSNVKIEDDAPSKSEHNLEDGRLRNMLNKQ